MPETQTDEKEYLFQYNHVACGSVAFYLSDPPKTGTLLMAEHAILLDGTKPVDGKRVDCGFCGLPITEFHLRHVTPRK